MSEIINQAVNVSTLSFEDTRDALAIAAISVAPATLLARFVNYKINGAKTSEPGIGGAVEDILDEVQPLSSHKKYHRNKWGTLTYAALGVGMLGINAMGPNVSQEVVDDNSAVVLVIDSSNPMRFAADMNDGLTRSAAVDASIDEIATSAPDEVRIGTVAYATDAQVTTPLTLDRDLLITSDQASEVDPNNVDLSLGLDQANSLLAGSELDGKNVIVLTSGTIIDRTSVTEQINAGIKAGEHMTVVIVGTPEGSYVRNEYQVEPTLAPATAEAFTGISGVEIKQASSVTDLTKAINETIKKETIRTKKTPFEYFKWAGETLLGIAGIRELRKAWKK